MSNRNKTTESKAAKKEEKKTKRQKEEEAIAISRRREGFIPYYSDTFFEKNKDFRAVFTGWILLIIFGVELGGALPNMGNVLLTWLITGLLIAGYIWIRRKVEDSIKYFGYQMEKDVIVRSAWGSQEIIPYTDIQRALITAPVKMTMKAIMVPSLHGYITFPYEIGNSIQQKHIMECYDALRKKVQCEMPPMETKNISYFDRSYFYNRSFRNCCMGLLATVFFFFGFNLIESNEPVLFIFYLLIALLQYALLGTMAKSIRLGKKNQKELQKRLTRYSGTTYKLKCHKTWQFILVALAVIGVNFQILWYCRI